MSETGWWFVAVAATVILTLIGVWISAGTNVTL